MASFVKQLSALATFAFLLSACGGGGDGTPQRPPPGPALPAATSLSFSGGSGEVEIAIKAPEDFLVESDSRGALLRRADFPVTRNNRLRDRQELDLPITVAGYVQRGGRPRGLRDTRDWFEFSADGGEVIDLQMSGRGRGRSTGDIDIRLFRERENRPGRFRFEDASLSRTPNERIVIQRPGRYVLRVDAFRGGASYRLSIGELDQQANGVSTTSSLRSIMADCDRAEVGTGDVEAPCRQAIAGQWLMTPEPDVWAELSTKSPAEVEAAQQQLVSSLGLNLEDGAGTPFMLATLAEESSSEIRRVASLNDMEVDPWEEDESAEFEWNGQDENGDGISDQFAMHFTAMMAKTAEEDGPADVASVSLNFVNYSQVIPSDDDNLTAVQFASHYGLINLENAWDSGLTGAQGNQDVLVAVIDTGQAPLQGNDSNPDWTAADSDMSDGEGKLRWGFDFVSIPDIDGDGDEGIDNDPTDVGPASATGFHGTHVAGTVAAPTGNGVGVQGVGRNISIMPIRVLGNCGCGSDFDIAHGVLYAAGLPNVSGVLPGQPADVINLSLGGGGSNPAVQDVYNFVREQGVIVIAAAGNSNTSTPSYPAAYDNVTSVVAVAHGTSGTPEGVVRAFYSNFGSTVDISAPGGQGGSDENQDGFSDGVLSTVNGGYAIYNGTSMAAPHVAGVAGLMRSVNPELTPEQFDSALEDKIIVTDIGVPGRDNEFGHGIVDALKAIEYADALGQGSAPPPAPPPLALPVVFPSQLDFGSSVPSLILELSNEGDAGSTLEVFGVGADDNNVFVEPLAINGSGLGTYSVTLDREGAAPGESEALVTFETSAGELTVPIRFFVEPERDPGDAGLIHVALLDSTSLEQVACSIALPDEGEYAVTFSEISGGDYLLVTGSDTDADGFICDQFEVCGASPTVRELELVTDDQISLSLQYSSGTQLKGAVFRACVN